LNSRGFAEIALNLCSIARHGGRAQGRAQLAHRLYDRETPMRGRQALLLIAHDCEPTVQLLASMQERDSYAVAVTLPATLRRRAVQVLARMLRQDGFSVMVAEGARETLRSLARSPGPEALLLDVNEPRTRHAELVRYARSVNPTLPVFVLCTSRDPASWQADMPAPKPVLFTKPIDYARLRLELSRVLRSHTGRILRVVEPVSALEAAANDKDRQR
jgi:CheY-like chemotaxis protein